jgi:hypothetical protein
VARLIATADGNFTAAATWATTDTTALVSTSVSVTALTAANLDSAAFIPGAITVDGVAVKLASRAAGAPTNTITITLRDSTAGTDVASVTANVSDLAACTNTSALREGGWYFFKFSAPVLLTAGNNHVIRAVLSATTTAVSLFTNGTANNWQHMLRTTTTQAPAAGDDLFVLGVLDGSTNPATPGARSVTMDSTAATDYGSATADTAIDTPAIGVGNRGTLTYGTTAATNYVLRVSGHLIVWSGGTLRIGNTGAEIPRDSTAVLEFDCASDGQFGLTIKGGATFTAYGLSRTSGKDQWMCKLTADSAIADTTLDVDTDTGWLANDEIAIAPTAQTPTQHERKTLSINAGAALLTITAGLASAKLGTGDYHAEVFLLTRNVEIRSVSSTNVTFVWWQTTATSTCQWVSFRYVSSNVVAFEIDTTTGSLTLRYCVVQDTDYGIWITGSGHGNWTIDKCVLYNQRSGTLAGVFVSQTTQANWTLTDFAVCGSASTSGGVRFGDVGGTIGNLWISGLNSLGTGISWEEAAIESANGPTFPANTTWMIHSNLTTGWTIAGDTRDITFPRTEIWRNAARAIQVSTGVHLYNVEFNGGYWIGNGPGSGEEPAGVWFVGDSGLSEVRFRAIDVASDSSFTSHWGILFDRGRITAANIQFIDCNFSQNSGTRRPVTVADIGCIVDVAPGSMNVQGIADNCTFNSSGTPVSFYYAPGPTPTRNSKYSCIRCPKFNGDATLHRTYTARGTLFIETTTVDVSPALRMDPLEGAAVPFDSNAYQPGWGFCVPVLSGQTVTVTVKVRKSAAYNGSTEPQLVQLANSQLGVASDAVIDTLSVAADTWETLTGTTAAAAADGVIEFVIRAYGTAGSVFVDTWGAS